MVKAPSLSECRKGGASSINLCNDCLLPVPISSLWGIVNCSRHIGRTGNPFFLNGKPETGPESLPHDPQENEVPLTFYVVCALS